LVFGALLLALLSGVPLALVARRRACFASVLLGTLNLLQTLPSIALFALLMGPLAWLASALPPLQRLGLGGTGAAPAVLALAAYALLPVVRNTLAGLDGVPPAALDAAHGMGMSARQRLLRVQLPLAWPSLLAGLRMVVVQSIGLATVAALIGAGGLGRFIFLGLGQGANDLVMLGTLAIIALALAADALFQGLQQLTERRG
jgi:osmoprotectant transport system permease protein